MKAEKCQLSNTVLCALKASSLGLLAVSAFLAGMTVKTGCINKKKCPAETEKPDAD